MTIRGIPEATRKWCDTQPLSLCVLGVCCVFVCVLCVLLVCVCVCVCA